MDDEENKAVSLSVVEHFRQELRGRPSLGIESTTVEERGVQRYMRNNYKDPHITLAEIGLNAPDNVGFCVSMFAHANRILRAAGWKEFWQVQEAAEKMRAEGGTAAKGAEMIVSLWRASILDKHGALSLEAKCAAFAAMWSAALVRAGDDYELLTFMADLCEASFWMQFEIMDYHHFVMEGAKAKRGRAHAPAARAARGQAKRSMTKLAVDDFLARHPDVLGGKAPQKRIIAGIFASLNEELQGAKLDPYKPGSLRNALRDIIGTYPKAEKSEK